MNRPMNKKRILGGLGLVVVLLAAIVVANIGPRNVIGLLRYDTRREGSLKVGDQAPAVALLALDGTTQVPLTSRLHGRPLVIVFGSFT